MEAIFTVSNISSSDVIMKSNRARYAIIAIEARRISSSYRVRMHYLEDYLESKYLGRAKKSGKVRPSIHLMGVDPVGSRPVY